MSNCPEIPAVPLILLEPAVTHFMKRRTLGNIRGATFTNVAFIGEPCRPAIRMWGEEAKHTVEGVRFENCTLFGRPLNADYPGLTIGEHTERIEFSWRSPTSCSSSPTSSRPTP